MTHIDTGVYGAKVQSWRRTNPRDILKRLMEENPRCEKQALLALFRDAAKSSEDHIDTIIDYWFANNYHSLAEKPPAQQREAMAARESAYRATSKKVQERIVAKAISLLDPDMIFGNGKSLRDNTFGYFGKLGGGFMALSRMGKPNQVVGRVLTDDQIRSIKP